MPSTQNLKQADPVVSSGGVSAKPIAVADLAPGGAARPKALAAIREAIDGPGYLCLEGILSRTAAFPALDRQMRQFFALDDDDPVKQAISAAGRENTNGWMPLFGEPAYQPGTLAHLESFDCGPEPPGDGRQNRWPAMDGFQDAVLALWKELGDAGFVILQAIADALGMETGFLADRCGSEALSTMRLLHYPAIPDEQQLAASVGIAAHTDFECITLIAQTAPGLELLDSGNVWREAPAGDDVVIVLFGDMLERWTNGTVRATGHRVRPRNYERFSIVKFFAVDDDVDVAPLSAFVTASRPAAPEYGPTRQRTHTKAELERAEAHRDAVAKELGNPASS